MTTVTGIAADTDPGPAHKGRSRRRVRSGKLGLWVGVGWMVGLVFLTVAAPLLPIQDPATADYSVIAGGPSSSHWLGTDTLGRDELSRLIYGARASLTVGFAAVVLGLTVGFFLGLVAGYFRGWADAVISAFVDIMLAFPALILIMVLVAVRGASTNTLIVGLGIAMVPTFTRLARANTLTWSKRSFVRAARMAGARPMRVLLREVAPNVMPPVLAYGAVAMSVAMVAEGSLSYLGFGVPPPTPSWGGMIAESQSYLSEKPHVVAFPAAMLVLTVAAFNLIGTYLRGRSDKRTEVVL